MTFDLLGVLAAGALTLVTPCVLPLIPIYLALLVDDGDGPNAPRSGRLTSFLRTMAFSVGVIGVFVALGLAATSVGAALNTYRTQLVLLGGLVILLFGLKLLGWLHVPFLERDRRLDDRRLKTRFRLLNALIMGLVFSLGWTPCVGPVLGSVLTYTASQTADPLRGALYLGTYGLGFVIPLLALSLFADAARSLVRRVSRWLPRLQQATGLLLVVVGVALIFGVANVPAGTRTATTAVTVGTPADPPVGQPTTRPRMVQFTSSSCSICRQMIPTVAVVERDCGGRNVDVVKIDVETPRNKKLASALHVRGVPTFLFLDRDGHEVARLIGHQSLPSLRQALAAVVGAKCDGVGSFEPDPDSCGAKSSTTCDK